MICSAARLLLLAFMTLAFVPVTSHAQTDDLAVLRGGVDRLYREGKYAEATAVARRYVDRAKQQHGSEHVETAAAISWLASSLEAEGRYGDAEPLHKRSLAIAEKALGPDHPAVGTSLNNLAGLYFAQRDWTRATAYLRRGTVRRGR